MHNITAFTKEERSAIMDTDQENKRKGFFKRIFPCYDFLYYKQFFEEDRSLNHLLDAKIFSQRRGTNQAMLRRNQALPLFMQKEQLMDQGAEIENNVNNFKSNGNHI